jgi:hypothetical protein
MRILRYISCFLISSLPWTGAAFAETYYPLITYKCDIDADIITITNTLLHTDEGKKFTYSDTDGTYSPWDMVDIEHKNNSSRITRTRKLAKTCKLSSGEYQTTLEPQVFSRDLSGRCGASISGAVTVEFDGIDIQERLPFEDYCHGNAPIITRVTVFGKTSEVKIKRIAKYNFY